MNQEPTSGQQDQEEALPHVQAEHDEKLQLYSQQISELTTGLLKGERSEVATAAMGTALLYSAAAYYLKCEDKLTPENFAVAMQAARDGIFSALLRLEPAQNG